MIHLTLNDKPESLDVDPSMPLLWALRDVLGLKGTKYGCGVGVCGICTILIDGQARAYSLNLLNRHEIVNDRIGDKTFAAVW